jgi:hypothetical protein
MAIVISKCVYVTSVVRSLRGQNTWRSRVIKIKKVRDWRDGEYRYVKVFALLPRVITRSEKDDQERTFLVSETRWLEDVYIMQRYQVAPYMGHSGFVDVAFVSEEVYEQNKNF